MSFKPAIHFSYNHFSKEIGKSVSELCAYWSSLFTKITLTIRYPFSNQHFYIDDISGHPILKISFHSEGKDSVIDLWDIPHGEVNIDDYKTFPDIVEIIHNIENHMFWCKECQQWVSDKNSHRYSFAGIVCAKCYDPKRHTPPDTSGD